MAALFGIHVGNTSACLAIWKDEDRVEIVANDSGDRVTPTIVQWTPNNCIVGRAAQLELSKNELNTVIRNKQLLNDNINDVELEYLRSCVSYKIDKCDKYVKYELLYEGKQHHILPRDIFGIILKKIYGIAKAAVGENKELNAVVTVPLHFSYDSVVLIRDVVKNVGFNVLQVIDEPSSVALGAGLGNSPEEPPYHSLIYRIGGVTLDAAVLLVQDGMFSVINSVHKYNFGGALFTEKLADFLANEFKRQYKSAELTERSKHKLFSAAENVKQILSIQNLAQCSADSVGGGFDLNCSVSRARFENMIAPYLFDVISPLKDLLSEACLTVDQIKKVVLCGGSFKIPKLRETVRNFFTCSEFIENSSPDELMSVGAATQAGYCVKYQCIPDGPDIIVPCLSGKIIVKVEFGDNQLAHTFILPEHTTLPLKKLYDVTCPDEYVTATVNVHSKAIVNLGKVELNELEPLTFVSIDLDINKDGILTLTLSSKSSCKKNCLKCDLSGLYSP